MKKFPGFGDSAAKIVSKEEFKEDKVEVVVFSVSPDGTRKEHKRATGKVSLIVLCDDEDISSHVVGSINGSLMQVLGMWREMAGAAVAACGEVAKDCMKQVGLDVTLLDGREKPESDEDGDDVSPPNGVTYH